MQRITDTFAVTGQLTPADIERAAANGVRSIINNRPDGEEAGGPNSCGRSGARRHLLFSPGHKLASVTYVIGAAAFVHDTLFMPDFGTARAEIRGGSSAELWRSIQQILALPDDTRLYVGHDYRPNGRAPRFETSVAEQKAHNPHLHPDMDEAAFVTLRNERDGQLPMPRLILHALQINIRGGRLPEPAANGRRYLRIPLDSLSGEVREGGR